MSETIQSISNGTYTIGSTSATNFIAGPGITIDSPSAGTVRIGNDETVLWENTARDYTMNITWPQTLSEPITNFEKVAFLYGADASVENAQYYVFNSYNNHNYNLVAWRCDGPSNDNIFWREAKFNCNGTSLTNPYNSTINLSTAFNGGGFNRNGYNYLGKIVGINRISGSNA